MSVKGDDCQVAQHDGKRSPIVTELASKLEALREELLGARQVSDVAGDTALAVERARDPGELTRPPEQRTAR